jgi:hypothetical protein
MTQNTVVPIAYLNLLLGGKVTQIFSLIQAQNLQVKLLVLFKSGESLIFMVFFFNLIWIHLESIFV